MTNRESKYPEEYDPQWQKNGRQPRRIFTAEPEPEQETKSDREMEPDNDSMAMLGPTILVAIAAIVIVCAAILYLCDLRDRCRYNQHWKKQRPKQKQQQPRRRNAGTSFPLDMIVTPSQKHHKKNPLSLSNDHNPSHPHSIDAGDIDPQQAAAVDWIRSIMPSSPISMEDQVPAQSPMMTSPVDLDEDHDIHLASLRIPAPDEDPVETPSLDIPTPHAGPIATAALTDRCAATYDEEEESQPTLLPVHDKVATGVDPEGKRTIDTTSPARPKAMLSPAAASALSPTRSGISILTEVSSDEEDTHDDDEELVTTPSQQFLRRELVSEEEEVDVTTTLANSKKMFTVPSSMERSPETLLEEERDATHQHPKAPNDDGDDELRIVELTEQTDEHSRLEHLVTSFSYHSEDDGSHEDFIRDIFYVPTTSTAGTKDISLQFIGASCPVTHPMITFVGDESPLVGRVFVGDFILRINEQEAGGMSSDDVLKFLVRSPRNEEGHVAMGSKAVSVKMIKLTVMSSHADGSDTEASVDIGRANSATEV